MQRLLKPEILDSLSPEDPAALHNRRDLRIINEVMGNHRWLRATLPHEIHRDARVLEIGAGTGDLTEKLRPALPRLDGLDLWPRPPRWPPHAGWHQEDILSFDRWGDYDAVLGNLIFHQFDAAALRTLGERLTRYVGVIVACEPVRQRRVQHLFSALCTLIRANHVSRHDGHVSIEAGFLGDELPAALGLDPARWTWRVETTVFGAYHLVAKRRVSG